MEQFKPREKRNVTMYSCGPSLYRKPHIGNYRTFLYEDILQRYLEYLGYNLTRLITLTDVEDKAIAEAGEAKIQLTRLTGRNAQFFFEDARLLRMKDPTYSACMIICTSTAVEQAAALIRILLKKGIAYYYKYKGALNVYFDPLKFKGFGKLSKLELNKWPKKKRRFHKDTYPGSPWNLGDFVLWNGYVEGDRVYWDTEIGRGRPAWNVQDAAMVTKYLGFTIDVACGGIDNLARHHDYTIAVVEGASDKEFARYWTHGQHLFVDGAKMSKSRGNVYYPADLVKRGYEKEHVRFFLVYGHYREPLNFTFKSFDKAAKRLDSFKLMVENIATSKSTASVQSTANLVNKITSSFERNMNRDLDVKAAFDDVFETVQKLDRLKNESRLSLKDAGKAIENLQKIDRVLQVIF